MNVAIFSDEGCYVYDMWSFDHGTPGQDTDLDGTFDLTAIRCYTNITNGEKVYHVNYHRLLDTKDKDDKKLIFVRKVNLIF